MVEGERNLIHKLIKKRGNDDPWVLNEGLTDDPDDTEDTDGTEDPDDMEDTDGTEDTDDTDDPDRTCLTKVSN